MSAFEESEYQEILLSTIRANEVVPFDCYLRLIKNNRVIRYTAKDEPFPQERLEKLGNKEISKLYLKKEDMPAYKEYLERFFKTDQGKEVLKKLTETTKPGEPIAGIPLDMTLESFGGVKLQPTSEVLDVTKVTAKAEQVQDTTKVTGIVDTQPIDTTKVSASKNPLDDKTKVAGVTEKIEDENRVKGREVHNEAISLLKNNIEALDEEFNLKEDLSDEESTKIKSVTDKIQEEITKVDGVKDPNSDEGKTVIENVTSKIREEISRVREISEKGDPKKRELLKKTATELEAELEELKVKKDTTKLKKALWKVKTLVDGKEDSLVSDVVGEMVAGLEKIYGTKLKIVAADDKGNSGNGNVAFAAGTANPNAGTITVTDIPPTQSEKEKIKALSELVAKQKKAIVTLQDKLTKTQTSLSEVEEKWEGFRASGKPYFSEEQNLKAESLSINIKELKNDFNDTKHKSENLIRVSSELTTETAAKLKINDKITISNGDDENEKDKKLEIKTTAGPQNALELSVPDETDGSGGIEQIRSENNVLRLQLQNAKSLVASGEKKIHELNTLVSGNTNYIEALEKEVNESKKTTAAVQSNLEKVEHENIKLSEFAADIDRIMNQNKAEIQSRDEAIRILRDENQWLNRDLKLIKDRYKDIPLDMDIKGKKASDLPLQPEFVALLAQREEAMADMSAMLEERNKEIKELNREIAKVKGQLGGINELKKQMNSKYEKANIEKDTLAKAQEAMTRKITIMANLSDKERKAVGKLTGLVDELRQERVEYINKTNSAMKGYKDALSKAASLNSHVEAEIQRNKKLQEQAEMFKNKHKEVMLTLAELQKEYNNLERENKRLLRLTQGKGAA